MRFLLVEDEPQIAELIQRMLHRAKYVVDIAPDLAWAKEALRNHDYPLIIVDRRLPDGDGIELIAFAKQRGTSTRFLILSALADLNHRVEGLDIGADDYITKPFEPEELLARIKAALRRPLPESEMTYACGTIRFNQNSRAVSIGDKGVTFSRRELAIVEVLLRAAGRVVAREVILTAVYGYDDEIQSNALESHISRIRKVLTQERAGVVIHTIRGVGYMIREQ